MELRECKKCLLQASGDEENYNLVKDYVAKIKPDEKCSEELYFKRLEICRQCDFLISGTCLKCGCYVEFRAAFKEKHCPEKQW